LASWDDLPGFLNDNLNDAWTAWLQSCTRSGASLKNTCDEVKRLTGQSSLTQREWLMKHFLPYRVESLSDNAASTGLLTAYYEPVFEASRSAKPGFEVPLHSPPASLKTNHLGTAEKRFLSYLQRRRP
jgi:membrane-bound lytic murein transglycosylase A